MSFKKNKIFFYAFLLNWALLLGSINTTPSEIFYFGQGLDKSINALRILFPLISSFILMMIFIINLKNNFLDLIEKKNLINFLFIFYFILQLLGLFTTPDRSFTLNNIYLVIFGINSLIALILINNFYQKKNYYKLNYFLTCISLLFIFAIIIVVTIAMYKKVGIAGFVVLYNFIDPNDTLFNQVLPRVTGYARMLAVLNVAIIAYVINKKLFKNKLYIILIFLLSTLIFFVQSRGAVLCFYSLIIIITIFQIKSFLDKLKLIIITILLPVCLHLIISNDRDLHIELKEKILIEKKIKINNDILKNIMETRSFRIVNNRTSSGRIQLWKTIIEKYEKNKIFGYGPQADRYLLLNKLSGLGYGNNASSAFFYSFSSAGYFGFVIIILINIFSCILLYNKIFVEKIFNGKGKFLEILSLYFIVFFLIRSLFENSISYFGIDFLLFIAAINALNWKNIYFNLFLKFK